MKRPAAKVCKLTRMILPTRHFLRRLLPAAACTLALLTLAWGAPAQGAPLKAMWGPAPLPNGASEFQVDQDLGAKIYQIQLRWEQTAPTKPKHPTSPNDPAYRWPAVLDTAATQAPAHGMQVAVMLIGAPPWANGGRSFNWAPRHARDFTDFAVAAAKRYPNVHLWMVWGEPNRAANYSPLSHVKPGAHLSKKQARGPHRYAEMLDASYSALKRLSSRNLIIGGMTYTTGDITTQQWIENMKLPNGKPPRMDLYGHNPFSFRKPDLGQPPSPMQQVDFSDLPRLSVLVNQRLRRGRGRQIKLFLSEFTIPTDVDSEFIFHVLPETQADWIRGAFNVARNTPSIYAVGWIHLIDAPPGGTQGGLLDVNGAPKPGFAAFQQG
ncbi:MAG: hypothetical protein NVSMB51_16160 [Solirubrobacteraceae bacterium]